MNETLHRTQSHGCEEGPFLGFARWQYFRFNPDFCIFCPFSILFSDSSPILVCKTSTCRVAPFPTSIALCASDLLSLGLQNAVLRLGRKKGVPAPKIGPGGLWGHDGHGMPNRGNAGIGMQTSAECWWMVNSTLEPHGTSTFSNIKTHGTLGTALKFQLEFADF